MMKGRKFLFYWIKQNFISLLIIQLLVGFLTITYSYLPIFIQYVFHRLGSGDNNKINLPPFLLDFYNSVNSKMRIIIIVSATLIIIQIFRAFLRFYTQYIQARLSEKIAYESRINMFNHIQQLPITYHNKADTGDLIQRCTSDIETSSTFISTRMPELINVLVQISFGAIQIGIISKQIMLISLAAIPIYILSSIIYFKKSTKLFNEVEKKESEVLVIIQENITNNRVVKAFANEKYEIDKLDKVNKELKEANIKATNLMSYYWGLTDFFTFVQYSLTLLVGVYLSMDSSNNLKPEDMMAIMMLLGLLIWPIRNLGRIINEFSRTITALSRISDVMEVQDEFVSDGDKTPEIKGNIIFDNVSYIHEDGNEYVLNNISFIINSGETIAIIGKTGSGKTTIINLLTKLLDLKEGNIIVDGVNIKDIKKKHLRKNIGLVMQEPYLFSKTIYENIAITNKNISKKNVYEAARIAAIDNDILSFENKYDTIVGEKGTTLSGGQKQRIAISRILLEEKPIIIFDDSLSAVDTKTDLMIRKELKKKKKDSTMILITHRITTAKEADKIIVIEKGRITDIGKHDDLIKKDGLYKRLWDIQGSLEKDFDLVMEGEYAGI